MKLACGLEMVLANRARFGEPHPAAGSGPGEPGAAPVGWSEPAEAYRRETLELAAPALLLDSLLQAGAAAAAARARARRLAASPGSS